MASFFCDEGENSKIFASVIENANDYPEDIVGLCAGCVLSLRPEEVLRCLQAKKEFSEFFFILLRSREFELSHYTLLKSFSGAEFCQFLSLRPQEFFSLLSDSALADECVQLLLRMPGKDFCELFLGFAYGDELWSSPDFFKLAFSVRNRALREQLLSCLFIGGKAKWDFLLERRGDEFCKDFLGSSDLEVCEIACRFFCALPPEISLPFAGKHRGFFARFAARRTGEELASSPPPIQELVRRFSTHSQETRRVYSAKMSPDAEFDDREAEEIFERFLPLFFDAKRTDPGGDGQPPLPDDATNAHAALFRWLACRPQPDLATFFVKTFHYCQKSFPSSGNIAEVVGNFPDLPVAGIRSPDERRQWDDAVGRASLGKKEVEYLSFSSSQIEREKFEKEEDNMEEEEEEEDNLEQEKPNRRTCSVA